MSRSRKRQRAEYERDQRHDSDAPQFGIGQTLSLLRGDVIPAENTETTIAPAESTSTKISRNDPNEGWQVASGRKRQHKSHSGRHEKGGYPELTHSPHARLQTQVRIGDLQGLVLYLLADGPAPQWVAVKHHAAIRKVVVIMVPGLERDMFFGDLLKVLAENEGKVESHSANGHSHGETARGKPVSPDDYYPQPLDAKDLPTSLAPMAHMFRHLWPVKTPGDDKQNRMHSPLQAMLVAALPRNQEEKQLKGVRPPREGKYWEDQPTPITKFIATVYELRDGEYTLHPSLLSSSEELEAEINRRKLGHQTTEDGWVDSSIDTDNTPKKSPSHKDPTVGRRVIAMDCEMCMVENGVFALTRISLVDWNGVVLMDELVKPDKPIINYLTQYSGMTAEKLEPVSTTLADIQQRVLTLLHPSSILIGHSLNSDLDALKLTHPFIIDTSILYPHPRGPPLKSSLKWLVQKYLSRDIQTGSHGHDSIEDARAALELVKIKCQRGPKWGTPDASGENIFKRLTRAPRPQASASTTSSEHCRSAIVDWGFPKRGYGGAADVCIGCESDEEVVTGVKRAVLGDADGAEVPGGGVDFVWARMRELEAVRGLWTSSKTADNDALRENAAGKLASPTKDTSPATDSINVVANGAATALKAEAIIVTTPSTNPLATVSNPNTVSSTLIRTTENLQSIYDSLPPCTAFIVYSGSGDSREYTRLLSQQQQNKRDYTTKKWDEVTKWGEKEERAMREACRRAREGVGFVCVK